MRIVALISVALVLVAVVRHNDDSDAQLYSVVARNMVRDDTWTQLSYAPNVHAVFREHLPFGFWPGALAIHLGGERALTLVAPLFTLSTLLTLAWLARRLGISAPLAVLALISTTAFLFTSAAFRLDAPLVFFSLLAAVPALTLDRPSWRGAIFTVLAATAATLIKGPFGLVPLVAAGLARTRLRWLWFTLATSLAGSAALIFFLLHARTVGSDWWTGFAEQQLLASALGTRSDGTQPVWYPLRALGEHCWPWLPLTLVGMWSARHGGTLVDPQPGAQQRGGESTSGGAVRRLSAWLASGALALGRRVGESTSAGVARRLTVWLVLMCCALALPSRKLWHHTLIVFPACALLAAHALERLRTRLTSPRVLVVLGVSALCFVALVPRGRAVSCTAFSAPLARVLPDEPIFVARDPRGGHWREVSTLAFEHRLAPWLIDTPAELEDPRSALALVPEDFPVEGEWTELSRARGWRLLERDGLLSARSDASYKNRFGAGSCAIP